jgi:hypothetical protein
MVETDIVFEEFPWNISCFPKSRTNESPFLSKLWISRWCISRWCSPRRKTGQAVVSMSALIYVSTNTMSPFNLLWLLIPVGYGSVLVFPIQLLFNPPEDKSIMVISVSLIGNHSHFFRKTLTSFPSSVLRRRQVFPVLQDFPLFVIAHWSLQASTLSVEAWRDPCSKSMGLRSLSSLPLQMTWIGAFGVGDDSNRSKSCSR